MHVPCQKLEIVLSAVAVVFGSFGFEPKRPKDKHLFEKRLCAPLFCTKPADI